MRLNARLKAYTVAAALANVHQRRCKGCANAMNAVLGGGKFAKGRGKSDGKAPKATPSRDMGFAVVWDARLMLLNARLKASTVAAAPASEPARASAPPLGA